jgi:hypothetical protein
VDNHGALVAEKTTHAARENGAQHLGSAIRQRRLCMCSDQGTIVLTLIIRAEQRSRKQSNEKEVSERRGTS